MDESRTGGQRQGGQRHDDRRQDDRRQDEASALAARLEAGGGGVFGAIRRRRAASRLAGMGVPAAAAALAAAYVRGHVGEDLVVRGLADQPCVDAVCEVAAGAGDEGLLAVIRRADRLPSAPVRRALFLFLGGRFEEYAEQDPDGALLAAAYASASAPLRTRLAERALKESRLEWVRAATGAGVEGLADAEWEAATGICLETGAAEELWRLVGRAPAKCGVRMLLALGRLEWRPADEPGRRALRQLTDRAERLNPAMAEHFVPADARTVPGTDSVRRLAVTPDGKLLAGSVSHAVRLWRLPSGDPAGEVPGGETAAWHLAVTGDSRLLLGDNTATRYIQDGHYLRPEGQFGWWELPSGRPLGVLSGDRNRIRCVALTPDGKLAATGDEEGRIRLWRLPSGKPAGVLTASDMPLVCLAVTADSSLLLCGDARGRVTWWSLPDGAQVGFTQGRQFLVKRLVPTLDNRLLITYGSNGEVSSWHLPSGRKAGTLVDEHLANAVTMSRDGRYLAAGTVRGVRLWHLPSCEPAGELATGLPGVRHVAVVPEVSLVVTHGWGSVVQLWDLESGAAVGELPGGAASFDHVVVTPDGRTVAATDSEGALWVWRLWGPELRAVSRTPVRELDPAAVQRLKTGASAGERDWLDLVTALIRHSREA